MEDPNFLRQNLNIELCVMPGMTSPGRSPALASMNVKIVECEMGETCSPSNSAIFGNELGYANSYYKLIK